jgi:HlyD family secretion protein
MGSSKLSTAQTQQLKHRLANPENALSDGFMSAVRKPPRRYTIGIIGSIGGFIVCAVIWAAVGKFPVQVEAEGKLESAESLQPVRTSTGGEIIEVFAKNNNEVKKGETLVKLNPKSNHIEIERLKELLEEQLRERARVAEEQMTSITSFRRQEYTKRIDQANKDIQRQRQEIDRQQAIIRETQTKVTQLQGDLETARASADSVATLAAQGVMSQNQLLEQQNQVSSLESEIQGQQERVRQAEAAAAAAQTELERLQEEPERLQAEEQREKAEKDNQKDATLSSLDQAIANTKGQRKQAEEQQKTKSITAPVSGTIYNLKASKGTVQPGEELLSIVPTGKLVVKANIQNRDRSTVREKMTVNVEIKSYPSQDYGYIQGTVIEISASSIQDEKDAWVFPVTIELDPESIKQKGINPSAGMEVTAAIVADEKRTVLQFLLDPVKRRLDDASKTQ